MIIKNFLFAVVGLAAFPVLAEIVPAGYWGEFVVVEEIPAEQAEPVHAPIAPVVVPVPPASVAAQNRAAATRSVSRAQNQPNIPGRAAPTRAVASRGTVAGQPAMGTVAPGVTPSRAAVPAAARTATPGAAAPSRAAVGRVQSARIPQAAAPATARAAAAPTAAAPTVVARSGSLYVPSEVARRVSIVPASGPGGVAGRNIGANVRTASTPFSAPTGAASSGPTMEELAQVTDFCRAQFTACMDGFCAVVDENQGRCACSHNIQRYKQTEDALQQITLELQQVAIQIQYLGLSRDEVTALFTATEAELALQSHGHDATMLNNDLNKIMGMVLDVRPDAATGGNMGGTMFDLSAFSFDANSSGFGFDFSALFGGGTGGSIVRQRGEELFRSATQRCQSVLDNCRAQGVDIRLITGYYDMEIDRQCVEYERALTEANTNMRRTVMNAQNVLRTARLQVNRNANQFDARGCVNALDSCMQNDFVCGQDYMNCLDPSGHYIVNGRIVIGSLPGTLASIAGTGTQGLQSVWTILEEPHMLRHLSEADRLRNNRAQFGPMCTVNPPSGQQPNAMSCIDNMLGFILNKIGHIDSEGRAHGMCANVMNRCQNITRPGDGPLTHRRYATNNIVVREFLGRTFLQIRAGREKVMAEFGESCTQEVRMCLSTNNAQAFGNLGNTNNNILSITARSACQPLAETCMSVTGRFVPTTSPSILRPTDIALCQFMYDVAGINATCNPDGTLAIISMDGNVPSSSIVGNWKPPGSESQNF